MTVVKCESLPKKDLIGSSDPFVRVYLMPGTHTELKTKVVKNTASPLFNDEFSFVVRITKSHNSHPNTPLSSSHLMMYRRRPSCSKCTTTTASSMMMTG